MRHSKCDICIWDHRGIVDQDNQYISVRTGAPFEWKYDQKCVQNSYEFCGCVWITMYVCIFIRGEVGWGQTKSEPHTLSCSSTGWLFRIHMQTHTHNHFPLSNAALPHPSESNGKLYPVCRRRLSDPHGCGFAARVFDMHMLRSCSLYSEYNKMFDMLLCFYPSAPRERDGASVYLFMILNFAEQCVQYLLANDGNQLHRRSNRWSAARLLCSWIIRGGEIRNHGKWCTISRMEFPHEFRKMCPWCPRIRGFITDYTSWLFKFDLPFCTATPLSLIVAERSGWF